MSSLRCAMAGRAAIARPPESETRKIKGVTKTSGVPDKERCSNNREYHPRDWPADANPEARRTTEGTRICTTCGCMDSRSGNPENQRFHSRGPRRPQTPPGDRLARNADRVH